MIVDHTLVDHARRLLLARFPDGPGRACAMNSVEGNIYSGAAGVDPEIAPIFEAV